MKFDLNPNPDIRNRMLRFTLAVVLTGIMLFIVIYTAMHGASPFEWVIITFGCLVLVKNAMTMYFQAFGYDPFRTIRNPWKDGEPVKNKNGRLFSHEELLERKG